MQLTSAEAAVEIQPEERECVVRFCRRFTHDTHVAEDLAQQTMIIAWQHAGSLRNIEARRSWLFGIARNVCLRWVRSAKRERSRTADRMNDLESTGPIDMFPAIDDFDIELELERDELARLLDQALALLPSQTRNVLIQRYICEIPQAEIAARLGTSEGAIEARLHRGRLALRRIITSMFREDALTLGLLHHDKPEWQETRIWCPLCGDRRLRALRSNTSFSLQCSSCSPNSHIAHGGADEEDLFDGVKGFKPMTNRLIQHSSKWLTEASGTGCGTCFGCGRRLPLACRIGSTGLDRRSPLRTASVAYIYCPACDTMTSQSLVRHALSRPEIQRFWREHPRMCVKPERFVEVMGSPAIVLGFAATSADAQRVDVVVTRERFEIVDVFRSPTH